MPEGKVKAVDAEATDTVEPEAEEVEDAEEVEEVEKAVAVAAGEVSVDAKEGEAEDVGEAVAERGDLGAEGERLVEAGLIVDELEVLAVAEGRDLLRGKKAFGATLRPPANP